MAMHEESKSSRAFMRKQLSGIILMLIVQFVLGMVVNLFGSPPDVAGKSTEPLFAEIAFFLHSFIGLGLFVNAILILVFSRKSGNPVWKTVSVQGFFSILFAFLAGLGIVALGEKTSELFSFIMAIGFLLAFICYGRFYYLIRG